MKYNKKSKLIIAFLVIMLVTVIFGALKSGKEKLSNRDVGVYNLSEISKYKTPYVGESSKVSHIASSLPVPDSYFKQQYISMETSKKPYGLTIYYEAAKDIEYEGEWPITTRNSVIEANSRANALVIFCMIDNVDKVTFAFRNSQSEGELDESKYDTRFSFSRSIFKEKYGDLSRLGKNLVLLEEALASITHTGDIYYLLNSGKRINKESINDTPNVEDYQIIKVDGEVYYIYIKEDKYYLEKPYQFIDEITEETYNNISEFIQAHTQRKFQTEHEFSKAVIELVEVNLATIMSSPKESSNPMDYIKAHRNEYEEIIKYSYKYENEEVLKYMLSQFEKGNVEGLRGHIMMALCKELLGVRNNVMDESLTPKEWYEKLDIRQEINLPDFSYDGDNFIEKLVYETEIQRNKTSKQGFLIVAPHIFGSYEEGNKLKVFTTIYSSCYRLYENVLSNESGAVIPVAITYTKNSDGSYSLEEYKEAKGGEDFVSSIKEFCIMPVSGKKIKGLADKILDHYSDYEDIIQLERENLIKHLKKNNQYGVFLYEEPYKEPAKLIPLT
ncbi:hypothetical protein JOC37_000555 [Desulfohalotomaculum tongense]|uniref:DUF5301 domain-containing protein n=1 Tax=Desulforadius tongensis TaxID=1216062 RepID=UPI001EE55A16|nr:DUF5301 domain-containing protein [Desulforadius tongensis]MBM7854183.1 hypothetical protein [Desulforadius tongensis]